MAKVEEMQGTQSVALERQYTPQELAELWRMTSTTIISMFRDEAGVLKYSNQTSKRRRPYVTLRIPASVAIRVYNARSR